MAHNPIVKTQRFEATRITLTSTKPYEDVFISLYASIGSPENVGAWPKIVKTVLSSPPNPQEQFTNTVQRVVGPHGFMIFQEFNHGVWIPLFGAGSGLKAKRVILGNPLIAITMLKHDLNSGLFVPVEILVLERKDGGTDVVYDLPSGLIAGVNKDPELVFAAEKLDAKLEVLVKDVLSREVKSGIEESVAP